MNLPAFNSKVIDPNYDQLNEEEKGIASIVFVISLMLLSILVFWTTGCWLLNIQEMVYLDAMGCLGFLTLFSTRYFFQFSYKWVRFFLTVIAILVTCVPIIFYGTDSLFMLHLVIIPMSGILMFSINEKVVFLKYVLGLFAVLLILFLWNFTYGPIYQLSLQQNRIINIFIATGGIGASFYYAYLYYTKNNTYKKLILLEREKSDRLLFNILPKTIAEELRENNHSVAASFENVTVIFIDMVGFSQLSSSISPARLVEILDDIFSAFDKKVDFYGIEKIKTIGDAYMAVCGLPNPDHEHCQKIADLALEINNLAKTYIYSTYNLKVRIGIHSGKVVAGVIGNKKFSYDLWGDTVNIASRFESAGTPDKIHITETVKNILGPSYLIEERDEIEIKGKGKMKSFYLVGRQ